MSIFGKIMSAIFGTKADAAPAGGGAAAGAGSSGGAAAAPAAATVDVAPILDQAVKAKGEKLEWVLQKGTELGVSRIIPVIARRTDSHLAVASARRVERWQRIALQAAQQCRLQRKQ